MVVKRSNSPVIPIVGKTASALTTPTIHWISLFYVAPDETEITFHPTSWKYETNRVYGFFKASKTLQFLFYLFFFTDDAEDVAYGKQTCLDALKQQLGLCNDCHILWTLPCSVVMPMWSFVVSGI